MHLTERAAVQRRANEIVCGIGLRLFAFVGALGVAGTAASQADPCGMWEQVPTPNPGAFSNPIVDADANDGALFALMASRDTSGTAAPVTYHLLRWDGASWTDLGEPGIGNLDQKPSYNAVGVAPNGDVWIGGDVAWHPIINPRPAVARWSPLTGWDDPVDIELMPMTVHPFTDRSGSIRSIAFAPDGMLFASGEAIGFGNALDTSVPLVLVFDGSNWTEVIDPNFNWPGSRGPSGIKDGLAFAGDNAWFVGSHPSGEGVGRGGIVIHYDGDGLTLIEDPRNAGIFLGRDLNAITASGPSDMWVAGEGSVVRDPNTTLAHFDGTDWTLSPSPYPSLKMLGNLVMATDGTMWAAGIFASTNEAFFDGTTWSLEPFAVESNVRIFRMARDVDGVLWAVGDRGGDSYVQRLVCPSNAEPAPLTDFDVVFGRRVAGGLNDLTTSDDLVVEAASQFGFSAIEPNIVDLRAGAASPIATPSLISMVIESRLNNAGGLAQVRMRNWDTSAFEQVGTYAVGTKEVVSEFPDLDATNRVRSTDRRIELSIRVSVVATFSASGFRALFDQIHLAVE